MSEFDTYLSHYAAKLSEFDSKLSTELESFAETLSDIDTKALVLWQARQHKANADPKKLRRSLYLQYWNRKKHPTKSYLAEIEDIKDTLDGWEPLETVEPDDTELVDF